MDLVIISDTHGKHRSIEVPKGDTLIFAGDMCGWGLVSEVQDFNDWLGTLPHKHKVVIAGNHDICLDRNLVGRGGGHDGHKLLTNAIYLENEGVTLDGIKFWGSPITPIFGRWAFMCDRQIIHRFWDMIPKETDVLITHGPMYKVLDYVDNDLSAERNVGCKSLLDKVKQIFPSIHACGHIHEQYGIKTLYKTKRRFTHSINASQLDDRYQVAYKPVVISI